MTRDARAPLIGLLALPLAVLLLAACGSTERPRADRPSPTATTTPTPMPATTTPTPSPTSGENGPLVPDNLQVPPPGSSGAPTDPPSDRKAWSGRVFGADFGWPQCPKGMGIPQKPTQGQPLPTSAARFVVIGLTNGPSFTPNPCLADHVTWAKQRHLPTSAYAVVSWPDAATLRRYGGQGPFDGHSRPGALSNTGYQAARADAARMRAAGLPAPGVFVDVEQVTGFEWKGTPAENAAVVTGAVRGFKDSGLRVGLYSTQNFWKDLVGGLRLGLPEWRAAGETSMAESLRRCRGDWSFQGGRGIVGQWVEDGRDRNVTCPGQAASASAWFHRF